MCVHSHAHTHAHAHPWHTDWDSSVLSHPSGLSPVFDILASGRQDAWVLGAANDLGGVPPRLAPAPPADSLGGRLDGGVWGLRPPGGAAGPGEAPKVSAACWDPGWLGPPCHLRHLILGGQPWKAAWRSCSSLILRREGWHCLKKPLTPSRQPLFPARGEAGWGSHGRGGADSEPAPLGRLGTRPRLHDTRERWHLWAARAPLRPYLLLQHAIQGS